MEFISSDTNVWLDFARIDRLSMPFLLPYTYLMSADAIDDEFLSPPNLRNDLVRLGLVGVDITLSEFELAESYAVKYRRLSVYDRIALAIAADRRITLLTGDRALRNAASAEGVTVIGTLGVIDRLYSNSLIDATAYAECLGLLSLYNGCGIRLPQDEIDKRIQSLKRQQKDGQ